MSTPSTLPRPIAAFISRSKELATAEPIIAYFCRLYAVEQILAKQLHLTDSDVATFAMGLLDDIETFKKDTDSGLMEIIEDKEASVAYVLNFCNKIFASAMIQIQEQRTTKQTAMSLLAVVNFFELLQLWKDEAERVEEFEEISKKTKYAKYHAARILKALKNGEDPNEYVSPANEFKKDDEEVGEEVGEEEVGEEEEGEGKEGDEKEEKNKEYHNDSDELAKEANTPIVNIYGQEDDEEIPVVGPKASNIDNIGLPAVPVTISQSASPQTIPKFVDDEPDSNDLKLPEPPKFFPDNDLYLPETPKAEPKPVKLEPKPVEPKKEINIEEILESNELYSKSQKHARFAISAMNYEDKATAVRELTAALELLAKLKD